MRNIQHRNRKYQQAYQDSLKSLLKYQTTIYKEHYDSNKKAKHKFALANQNNTYLQQLIRNANTQKQTRSEKISQLVSVKQEYLKVSQKTNSENQQLRQQILKKIKIIQELLKQQYSQKICIQQDKQFIQDQKNLIMKQCQSIQKDINISKDQKQKLKYTLQQKIKSIETQRQRQKNNILQQIKIIKQLLSNGQIQISKLQNTIQLNQQQIQQRINHRLNVYTTFDQEFKQLDNQLLNDDQKRIFILLI